MSPTAQPAPRWRRRKAARPAEIVAAAYAIFSERGYAAARLEDVAARAGVSKAALYLYFATKQDLFEAVVRDAVAPNLEALARAADDYEGSRADLLRQLFQRAADLVQHTPIGGLAKLVISESRNFPEVARVWHDRLVSRALPRLAEVIAEGQARGEFRPADPRLAAFALVAPLLMGVLWRETFEPVGGQPLDLQALARQHVDTVLAGLAAERPS